MHPRVPARPIRYNVHWRLRTFAACGAYLSHPKNVFPDISLRDEGFEISSPFTLRLLQSTSIAFAPARQVQLGRTGPANTLERSLRRADVRNASTIVCIRSRSVL